MLGRRDHGYTPVVSHTGVSISPVVQAYVLLPEITPVFSEDDSRLIEFWVYDSTKTKFLGQITRRQMGTSWTDSLNTSGTGNLNISLSDPALVRNPALLNDRNIIVAVLRGEPVYAWRVQGGSTTLVGAGEAASETTSLAGPNVLELLKDARLNPDFDIKGEPTKSSGERRFGYMSPRDDNLTGLLKTGVAPWYVSSKWTTSFKAVLKTKMKKGPWEKATNYPESWPDRKAYILWPTDPNTPTVAGTVFFRSEFTMAEDALVSVYASADNKVELFLDGNKIIEDIDDGLAYTRTSEWSGKLTKGKHLLVARVINDSTIDPAKNWGGFLCSVMKLDAKLIPQEPAVHNSKRSGWRVYYEGNASVPYKDTSKTVTQKKTEGSKKPLIYTVKSGDTLTKIGVKYKMDWKKIYNANKKMIDSDPRIASLPKRPPAWWIFPKMKLVIPGLYTDSTRTVTTTSTVTTRTWSAGTPLTTPTPAWFAYQILAKVFTEGKHRGVQAFKNVVLGYENDTDSDGEYWPSENSDAVERSFAVGSSVYEVAQQLVESGIDIRMGPDLVLNAYSTMGFDRGLKSSSPFRLMHKGYSTLTYTVNRSDSVVNDLYVQTDDGWRRYTKEDSVGEYGRVEGSISVGGVEPEQIMSAIGAGVDEVSEPLKIVETTFRAVEGRFPYVDFDLGDTVVAVDEFNREFDVRIVSMSVTEPSEGDLHVSVEASGKAVRYTY